MCPQVLLSYSASNRMMLYSLCITFIYIYIYEYATACIHLYSKPVVYVLLFGFILAAISKIFQHFFFLQLPLSKIQSRKYHHNCMLGCMLSRCHHPVELWVHPISRSSCVNTSSTNAKKSFLCSFN